MFSISDERDRKARKCYFGKFCVFDLHWLKEYPVDFYHKVQFFLGLSLALRSHDQILAHLMGGGGKMNG